VGAYGIAGDPAGMRALAAYLRTRAGGLGLLGSRIAGNVNGMIYQGPAASAFKGDIGQWQFAAGATRYRLEHLADLLTHEAARVEALQEEARREHERREREARERAQARSGR
jgi:uncharacterized protein YukE